MNWSDLISAHARSQREQTGEYDNRQEKKKEHFYSKKKLYLKKKYIYSQKGIEFKAHEGTKEHQHSQNILNTNAACCVFNIAVPCHILRAGSQAGRQSKVQLIHRSETWSQRR